MKSKIRVDQVIWTKGVEAGLIENKLKDFLDKLDKAMEAEKQNPGYKPYQKKEEKKLTNQEIFEQNLNKALEQEEKNSGYHPSGKQAGKKPHPKNDQQDFINKLDKEMEDEEKNQNINQVDIIQKILNLKIIQKKI